MGPARRPGGLPTALLGLATAPNLAVLALALAVMATANSVVDVAMNAPGTELERRYRRPIMSSLHAGYSAGLFAGGLAGTAAAAAAVPPLTHFAVVAAVGVVAGLAATRWLVDEPAEAGQPVLTAFLPTFGQGPAEGRRAARRGRRHPFSPRRLMGSAADDQARRDAAIGRGDRVG